MTSGGFGLQVKIEISEVMTAVVGVLEGSELPKLKKFIADATPHSSPGGWTQRVASGKRSAESFKLVLGWDADEDTHEAMRTAFDSNEPVNFVVISPDNKEQFAMPVHIEEIGGAAEQEGIYQAEVMITPADGPTITTPEPEEEE